MYIPGTYGKGETFYLTLQDTDGNILTSHTFSAGDAKIGKDGGALANLNTLPTITNSQLVVALSDTEMEAKQIVIQFHDQTTTAEWLDSTFIIKTTLNEKLPITNLTDLEAMDRNHKYILIDDITLSGSDSFVFDSLDLNGFQFLANMPAVSRNYYFTGNELIDSGPGSGSKQPSAIFYFTTSGTSTATISLTINKISGILLKNMQSDTSGTFVISFYNGAIYNLLCDIATGDGVTVRGADSVFIGLSNAGSYDVENALDLYKAIGGYNKSVIISRETYKTRIDSIKSTVEGLNDLSSSEVQTACEAGINNQEPIDANVTQLNGAPGDAVRLSDFVNSGYDATNNRVLANVKDIDGNAVENTAGFLKVVNGDGEEVFSRDDYINFQNSTVLTRDANGKPLTLEIGIGANKKTITIVYDTTYKKDLNLTRQSLELNGEKSHGTQAAREERR